MRSTSTAADDLSGDTDYALCAISPARPNEPIGTWRSGLSGLVDHGGSRSLLPEAFGQIRVWCRWVSDRYPTPKKILMLPPTASTVGLDKPSNG
jgi:hypothetical protein